MSQHDLSRRDFIKGTAGAAGITGLAGCNTDGGDDDPDGTDTDGSTGTDTSQDPTYSLQTSALEYDLTDLATSEADTHDEAYVENNYSAELGVTVLENGEEADLEELGDVHLENEEGEQVETTEEGYVPEYAVEDGQELTVRAEINGETVEETITVTKELPNGFYADARIQEDGEVLYDTDWTTPYSFDNHIVDRQAFLDQRSEKREQLSAENIISESDEERFDEEIEKLRSGEYGDFGEEELVGRFFGSIWSAINGLGVYEGSEASVNSMNMEQAMLDNFDYRPVFVGGFTNPKEPDVPSSGDGEGFEVNSKLAFVDGDWYHGTEDFGYQHISKVNENPMAQENSGIVAVSVLAEFERGNTELLNHDDPDEIVEATVTSPVTLNGNMTELELSDDISWNALNQIRENTDWTEAMAPLELATAIGSEIDGNVEMEGETPGSSRIKLR